ncbi:MAG TPA: type II secretion system F family protein, partial [Burkholderiales bacterium]|nr:type II secretion system F family protein [Burkholderiales bacterium]
MFLPLLAFAFGSIVVGATAFRFMPGRLSAIDRRLEDVLAARDDASERAPRMAALIGFVKRVGEKAPQSTKELGSLRLRLVQAGYRRPEALTMFFGIRVLVALTLFALFASPIIARPNMLVALGGLGIGYLLPGMVLARMAKRRSHRIRLALPDALDLLVVSVEAGLGLDQALSRVAAELSFAYPDLSDELKMINLELRAGKPRAEALRNMA